MPPLPRSVRPLPLTRLVAATLLCAALATAAVAAPPTPPRGVEPAPDRPWDLQVLTLDLALLPDEGRVEGTATYTLALRAPPAGATRADLVLDQVGLEVRGVTTDGAPATWHLGPEAIVVELDASAGPGQQHTVVVDYSATPRTGLHFRRPSKTSPDTYPEVWSQGEGTDNRYWFPGYDHPNERFRYEGHITAPKGWKVLTNTGLDVVNYLVMVAAGPYDVHGDELNQVWVPPATPRAALTPILDPIPAMQAHFAQRTGVAYPWGPYRQVIVQRFLYGGMENTSATIESSRLLLGPRNQTTRNDPESVVAHELAHQWYGDLLTCADWHHLWLNEGFASYFGADWMAQKDAAIRDVAWAAQTRGWYRSSTGPVSLTGAWYLGADTPPNGNVYSKGASLLEMLRHQLGDGAFWAGIRLYTTRHAYALVETRDLQRAMEEVSGQELDWFFRQWAELPTVPQLDATWAWAADSGLTVNLHQLVDDTHPAYHLPVRLLAGGADGQTHAVVVPFEEERRTVQVALDWRPTWVALDPDGALLIDGGLTQPAAAWAAQLGASPPYARLVAIENLGRVTGAEAPVARAALAAALADATLPGPLREAAAAALGEQRDAAALLALLDDRAAPPRLRLAAARAVRAAARPEDATHLAQLRGDEPTGDIRSALHEALTAASPERGVAAARLVLRSTAASPGTDAGTLDIEYNSAAAALGDHGAVADLGLLLAVPVDRDRRTAGLAAAARIVSRMPLGPDREAARAKVARSAEAALLDLDLRGRQAGIGILREVGDARSIEALEAFRREEEIPSVIDAARDAVAAIRARRDTIAPPTPNEVDARLQELEDRLKALERRDETWMGH